MREEFEKEVDRWIEEDILIPWKDKVKGFIPSMAVEQPTKNKVRPVLDFRELNQFVEYNIGNDVIDNCDETLREWRQMSADVSIVDLKSAYLQLKIKRDLWKYQLVEYKGNAYFLTRLEFGLNCATRIISKILKSVLARNESIKGATSSYIDDILVDESKVSSDAVVEHLRKYWLVTKDSGPMNVGAALGLKLTTKYSNF